MEGSFGAKNCTIIKSEHESMMKDIKNRYILNCFKLLIIIYILKNKDLC